MSHESAVKMYNSEREGNLSFLFPTITHHAAWHTEGSRTSAPTKYTNEPTKILLMENLPAASANQLFKKS